MSMKTKRRLELNLAELELALITASAHEAALLQDMADTLRQQLDHYYSDTEENKKAA